MLREQGRIQNEIDNLKKERMALNREVDLAKFLREKVGNNEQSIRKLATVLSSQDMSNRKIYDLIGMMGRMVKDGIDPDVLIERGEVLDFLRKFGFNVGALEVLRRKYAFYPGLDILIEEVLKQGDRKEEMLKRAEYEVEEYKKAAEASIENTLKERRDEIVELETRIAGLKEKKSLLENDVNFLKERVEDLKLERWKDIGKLEFLASLIGRKSFDTLGILFGRLVSTLENMKIPPLLVNSVRGDTPLNCRARLNSIQ